MTNPKTMRIDYDAKAGKVTATITTHTEREDEYGMRVPNYMAGHIDVIAGMILETAEHQGVEVIEMPRGGLQSILTDELADANRRNGSPLRVMTIAQREHESTPQPAETIDPDAIGTGSQAAILVSSGICWVVATAERVIGNELRWFQHHVDQQRTLVRVTRYDEKHFRMLSHLSPAGNRVEVGS